MKKPFERVKAISPWWETLTPEQISGIGAVAMDMWDPYVASVRAHLPEADGKIVFDKFHVAQHFTYLRHRIANAASESINAKVQWVKYTARGFRNRQNFVHAIYFHRGGLDRAPESTK